ncbi:MAG: hypothetical protein QM493_10145 [Sulfurovum sp.]
MRKFNIIKVHPIQNSNHLLVIHEMEKIDIDEWRDKHHPQSKENNSSDGEWSWLGIFISYKIANILGQKVKGYVYRINGEIFGISIVAYDYPCHIKPNQINPYLWYIVKSPHSQRILFDGNISENIKFQKYVYDIIYDEVTKSQVSSSFQTFWLHADPTGKDKLLNMYKDKGFVSCTLIQQKIVKYRSDDSRYLYLAKDKFDKLSITDRGVTNV